MSRLTVTDHDVAVLVAGQIMYNLYRMSEPHRQLLQASEDLVASEFCSCVWPHPLVSLLPRSLQTPTGHCGLRIGPCLNGHYELMVLSRL